MEKLDKLEFEEAFVRPAKIELPEEEIEDFDTEEEELELMDPWEFGFKLGAMKASEDVWLEGDFTDED